MEGGLNGRPIDLIRLGQLYLQGGNWNGTQLISKQWISESTDYATANTSRFADIRYGMGWWTRVIDGTPVFYEWGHHGQYVLVAPSLDIVVARFGVSSVLASREATLQAAMQGSKPGRRCLLG